MALTFPTSPTVGQQFTGGNQSWEFNGTAWLLLPSLQGFIKTINNQLPDASGNITVNGISILYKSYVAIVTQANAEAPTAIVLENTLGGPVVWSRNGSGDYRFTATGLLTVNKTIGFLGTNPVFSAGTSTPFYRLVYTDVNSGALRLTDSSGNSIGQDGRVNALPVEIRVYL